MLGRARTFLEMIKFEHTVFALPFAYLGMVLAAGGWPGWWKFSWITIAMAAARTAGMSLNRLIDRHIDARNPRTAVRPLPRGLLTTRKVWALIAVCLAVFVLAAWMLNDLCLKLLPLGLLLLIIPLAFTGDVHGRYWCRVRCNVHVKGTGEGYQIEGEGRANSPAQACDNAEIDAKSKLAGRTGHISRHCHPIAQGQR